MTDEKINSFNYIDEQLFSTLKETNPDRLKDAPADNKEFIDCDNTDYFRDEYIIKLNVCLKLPDEAVQAVLYALDIVRKNRGIRELLCNFLNTDFMTEHEKFETVFEHYNTSTSGMFQLLLVLFALDKTLKKYKVMNVPYDVAQGTLTDINIWVGNYRNKNNGRWGLSNLAWMYLSISAQMFRIGSLQYLCKPFHFYARFYRNTDDNSVMILSKSGIKFRQDGLLDGTNDICDENGGYVTELDEDESFINSNCFIKDGYAHKKDIKLPKPKWEAVLYEGVESLAMHIPEGAKISYNDCLNSLYNANMFFSRRFQDKQLRTFHCGSWLLEPQLQKLLPSTSNIVAFQKFFHLFPLGGWEYSFFDRAFGVVPDNFREFIKTAPRNTTLQRAIIDHLSSGKRLHAAAGAIFFSDVLKLIEKQ